MRAVLWAAVSSKPQLEGDSLDKQIADGEALCASLDPPARIVATLQVPGHSRSVVRFDHAARDMPAYAELESLCERRAFDVLVCRSVDRLGRTAALVATVTAIVTEAGARVFELENPTPLSQERTDADLYIGAFRQAQAEADVRQLQRRREWGMRARIRKGLSPGRAPYGYRLVGVGRDSRALVVPEQAAIVRRIFAFFLRGWSTRRIAGALNADGARPQQSATWHRNVVWQIITNPFYAGEVAWGRGRRSGEMVTAAGSHEPLLDAATWQQVQAEHARRAVLHSRGQSSPRLFAGVLYCAECGTPLRSVGGNAADPHHPPAYRCQRADGTSHNQIPEARLLARLRAVLADLRAPGGVAAALAQVQARRAAPPQAETDALTAELAAAGEERKRLDVAYVRGKALSVEHYEEMAGEIEARRSKLAARLRALEARQAAQEDTGAIEARLRAFSELDLDHADPPETRALMAKCLRLWILAHQIDRVEFV